MNDDAIDALVRAHLDKSAEAVDPRPLFDRIRGEIRPATVPFRRNRSWAWAAAAVLLIGAFFVSLQFRPSPIAAESIVRETQEAHRLPVDRCYLVEMRREPGSPSFPSRPDHSTVKLWTREDRFWLESDMPGARWAWGRDATGGVWLATFGGRLGVRLEPDEVPPWLAMHADMNSLRLETMLGEVLGNFDLERTTDPASSPATLVIQAKARPYTRPPSLLRRAVLEIDSETRVLRRAVLSRGRFDQLYATTTYTLIDSQVQDDELYQIEGHLKPGAEILTRDHQPARRRELFGRFFGPGAEKWIKPGDRVESVP